MAQLKKSENQMDAAIVYAQNALKNPDSGKYESAIENSIADGYNLRVYPSPDNSNFVATVKNQVPVADQNVFGTNVQSRPAERVCSPTYGISRYMQPQRLLCSMITW